MKRGLTMHKGAVIGLAIAFGPVLLVDKAHAAGSVSDYLSDGWEIKAASQISSNGYTQIILQKGNKGMICTIYYSVAENGWSPRGCEPPP
jgi:hypothetical protein